jgi:predicted dehydrogenase
VNEAEYFRNRLRELDGPLTQGVVNGITTNIDGRIDHAAIIHGIAFSHAIFGPGVKWVECMSDIPLEYMLLGYENDLQVVVINSTRAFDGFRCSAHSRQGWNPPRHGYVSSYRVGDHEFVGGALNILKEFKKMVQTRKPPLPYADMLELIAIIDAGKKAHAENRRVMLEEITTSAF